MPKRYLPSILHLSLLFGLVFGFSPALIVGQDAFQVHHVQAGETLFKIALRYGVDMNLLAEANNIFDLRRIYAGQELIIPGTDPGGSYTDDEVINALVASTPTIHVIQRGETFNSIAQQYGISPTQLLQANNIQNPNRILAGQTLNIWTAETGGASASTVADNEPSVVHVVQRGEYLSQIAARYEVSWPIIATANNLTVPDQLYAGQELIIPGARTNAVIDDMGILPVPASGPGASISSGKQIVVDLSDSRIYAYEDGVLKHNVLVSTGLPLTPTVLGDYNIYWKLDKQRMIGPGYNLPDVPWVMYFFQGYAIHGTYWHNNFGRPMSHGCVNLPTTDAAWFYQFGEVGTPVHVQG